MRHPVSPRAPPPLLAHQHQHQQHHQMRADHAEQRTGLSAGVRLQQKINPHKYITTFSWWFLYWTVFALDRQLDGVIRFDGLISSGCLKYVAEEEYE